MDYAAQAERHRHMAELYRTMAECTPEDSLSAQYRRLAEAYEQLADKEVRIARNIKFSH
jgi:hypothetical protein